MNAWRNLLSDVFRFWNSLRTRPRFLIFLIVIVLGVGGLGIWIPLGQLLTGAAVRPLNVYRSFATYAIAIAITSFAEFLLEEDAERTLLLLLFGLVLAASVPAVIILVSESLEKARICTWVSSVFTMWVWLIALSDRPIFDEANPQDAIGGTVR